MIKKIHTYRYEDIVKEQGRDVMAFIVQVILEESSQESTTKEKLLDIGIYKKLDKLSRRKIDARRPLDEEDITFLYSIILEYSKVRSLDPNLFDLLKEVKSQRNEVSHEYHELNKSELETKVTALHQQLIKALNETERLYPGDIARSTKFNDMRLKVDQSISEILKTKVRESLDPTNPEDYKIQKEEHKVFWSQSEADIQCEAKDTLLKDWRTKYRVTLMGWLAQSQLTKPSNIAVSLKMETEKVLHSLLPLSEEISFIQNDIISLKDQKGNDPDVVLISGEAGMGKTTLLRLIGEKWTDMQHDYFPGLDGYLLVFYFEFRENTSNTLESFLKERLQCVLNKFDQDLVKSAVLSSRCLFLCDGFDERNSDSMAAFEEMLKITSSNAKFIVTTRPINALELSKLVNKHNKLKLSVKIAGIPVPSIVESMKLMADQAECSDDKKQEIVNAYESMAPQTKYLMTVPLYNQLITTLMMACPGIKESLTSVTRLFVELRKHEMEIIAQKIGKNGVDDAIKNFMSFCNTISLRHHLEGKYELTGDDVQMFKTKCDEFSLPFEDIMSTLFTTKFSQALLTEKIFCYKHRTDQEFGAACAICSVLGNEGGLYEELHQGSKGDIIKRFLLSFCPEESQKSTIDKEDFKGLRRLFTFVTGVLSVSNKVGNFIKELLEMTLTEEEGESFVLDDFLQHLSESGVNPVVVDAVLEEMKKRKIKKWILREGKTLEFAEFLIPKIKPDHIQLELNVDSLTIPHARALLVKIYEAGIPVALKQLDWFIESEFGCVSELFLEGSRSLELFWGLLNKKGISLLSEDIQELVIRTTDLDALEHFNTRLSSLNQLRHLCLYVKFSEIPDHGTLSCPLQFSGQFCGVFVDLNGYAGGDNSARNVAEFINSLWSEVREASMPKRFSKFPMKQLLSLRNKLTSKRPTVDKYNLVFIIASRFSGKDIFEFLSVLERYSITYVYIHETLPLNEEERKLLTEKNHNVGFEELMLPAIGKP